MSNLLTKVYHPIIKIATQSGRLNKRRWCDNISTVINMEKPSRKQNRLPDYDYSQSGAYFVTICTQDRKKILSKISVGTPLPGCPQIPHDENGHPGTGVPTVELLWHGEIANHMVIIPALPNILTVFFVAKPFKCSHKPGNLRCPRRDTPPRVSVMYRDQQMNMIRHDHILING